MSDDNHTDRRHDRDPTPEKRIRRAIDTLDPADRHEVREALEELVARRDSAEERVKRHCRDKIEAHVEKARAVDWLQAANTRIQRYERTLFEIAWGLPGDTAKEYAREALGVDNREGNYE